MRKANSEKEGALGGLGNLRRLIYFASVVETGSFTSAADRLGITKAVVSQQVARLERELRASLLVRTTRKVQTTEAGQKFYQRCASILRDAESAFDELSERSEDPSGTLRLTAPFDYGVGVVVPTIAAFIKRHAACKVDAVLTDQTMDMMAGGIELAIRVGWLADTTAQARRIGGFHQLLVASPAIARQARRLAHPKDLVQMPFVANTALREPAKWTFSLNAKERHTVKLRPSIFLDATLAVREAALQGAGLCVMPDFTVTEDLAAGRLVQILPQWRLPSGGIHVVFPAARFRPAKVRAFVELLALREQERQGTVGGDTPG